MASVATLLALTELGLRLGGAVDFPVYVRHSDFGYAPQPAQEGRFLKQNEWVFNNRGMGVAQAWRPTDQTDILLVGNSIILGGNTYDQKDKITPLTSARLQSSCALWPIAAGGWTTVNELRFLERNPDVVANSDFFIWEYMAHQMGGMNPWTRETMHPTRPPVWATGYLVRKALDQRFPVAGKPVLQDPIEAAENYKRFDNMLRRLAQSSAHRPAGVLFLYPDQQQLVLALDGKEWLPDRSQVERLAATHGVEIIDIAKSKKWGVGMYRDGVHPTTQGNAVLASILAEAVLRQPLGC